MYIKIYLLRVVFFGCFEGNFIEKEVRWEGRDVLDKMKNYFFDIFEMNVLDVFISKINMIK